MGPVGQFESFGVTVELEYARALSCPKVQNAEMFYPRPPSRRYEPQDWFSSKPTIRGHCNSTLSDTWYFPIQALPGATVAKRQFSLYSARLSFAK